MATRSKYVFLTLPEFGEWLRATTKELDIGSVLYLGPKLPLEPWNGSNETLVSASRVYLMAGSPDLTAIRADDLKPGQYGWLQMDVPRMEDGRLMVIQIAAKSDWFDAVTGGVMESRVSLALFDKVWRKWGKYFTRSVWARNRLTGAESWCPSIGCSVGAIQWFRRGGELRQRGVANLEFTIRDSPQ